MGLGLFHHYFILNYFIVILIIHIFNYFYFFHPLRISTYRLIESLTIIPTFVITNRQMLHALYLTDYLHLTTAFDSLIYL